VVKKISHKITNEHEEISGKEIRVNSCKFVHSWQRNDKKRFMKTSKTFEQLLIEKYGEKGTQVRDQFDGDSLAFRIGVMLKEARVEANLTQEELADKTGTKKVIFQELNEG